MNRMRTVAAAPLRALAFGLACLLAAAAGCSEASRDAQANARSTSAGQDIDTCALLTATEIEEVTGRTPAAPTVQVIAQGQPPLCTWDPPAGSRGGTVSVMVVPGSSLATFEDYLANARELLGEEMNEGDYVKVEGLGRYGVWTGDETYGALQVFTGKHMIQVSADPVAGMSPRELATALMRKALPRMPG